MDGKTKVKNTYHFRTADVLLRHTTKSWRSGDCQV